MMASFIPRCIRNVLTESKKYTKIQEEDVDIKSEPDFAPNRKVEPKLKCGGGREKSDEKTEEGEMLRYLRGCPPKRRCGAYPKDLENDFKLLRHSLLLKSLDDCNML